MVLVATDVKCLDIGIVTHRGFSVLEWNIGASQGDPKAFLPGYTYRHNVVAASLYASQK